MIASRIFALVLALLCVVHDARAFVSISKAAPTTARSMGLLNDLNIIFSDEGKKNRKAYDDRQRREQEEAQRAILEARRNPNKKKEYQQKVNERRNKLDAERKNWSFQKDDSGADPLQKWKELRSSGKIKAGDDIARDPTSSRLGSAGLQDVRTDDKLPYIEQGYVDESADVFANFKKMFGGKKE